MARKTAAHNAMFTRFHQARGGVSPLGGVHHPSPTPPPAPPAELDPGISAQQREAISFAGSQAGYAATDQMAKAAGLPGPIVIADRRPLPADDE